MKTITDGLSTYVVPTFPPSPRLRRVSPKLARIVRAAADRPAVAGAIVEHILEVMTTGSMRTVAANISDADKRLLAEWVAGRKLDTDLQARQAPEKSGSGVGVTKGAT